MKKILRPIFLIMFSLIVVCLIRQPALAAVHEDFSLFDYEWKGGARYTEGDYQYIIIDEEAFLVEADESLDPAITTLTGHVKVPSSLGGYPVTFIYGGSFRSCTAITEITVPDSVITIGFNCFEDCTSLKTVNIGANVKTFIGRAFAGCTALETVNWGPKVTKIGRENFYDCESLTSITIPDSVTTIDHSLFYYCENLEYVKLSENLTDIPQSTFHDCYSLKSIVIPDSVQSIGNWAFAMPSMYVGQESKLESVVIGSGVKSIGLGAFYQCTALTTVTMNQSVEIIEDRAFVSCESLQAIHIPDTTVTIEEHAFDGCKSLAKVTLGNGVKTIGTCAFDGCYSLEEIIIPDSTTEIGNRAFQGCRKISSLKIGANVEKIDLYAFAGCSSVPEIVIPDSVTYLGQNAFSGCSGAKTATIGKGVTELREKTFYGCSSLETITIAEIVTAIGDEVFNTCASLQKIVVAQENPNYCADDRGVLFNKDKTRLIQAPGAISGSYTVPETVTVIGDHAFYECKQLEQVAFPDSLKTIEGFAFYGCDNLEYVDYGNGLEEVPGSMTFAYCHKLTEVNLPDSCKTIGPLMYHGCAGLVDIEIADSVETIGAEAFAYCSNLRSVKLGSGVTEIKRSAFEFAEKLQQITVFENLKTVEDSAFYRADSLTDVYYGGTRDQWYSIDIVGYDNGKFEYANIHFINEPTILPEPVVEVAVNAVTGGGTLTWSHDGKADCYEIHRATSSKGKYTLHKTVTEATADVSVPAGKTYYYKVMAICDADPGLNSCFSSVVKVSGKCAQPQVTVKAKEESGKPYITWDKVSGAKKYYVYRVAEDGTMTRITSTTKTYYTDTKAVAGKTCSYVVRAIASSSSYNSSDSKLATCVCRCAQPKLSISVDAATGKPVLTWKSIAGASNYRILRKLDGEADYSVIQTVDTLTYIDALAPSDTDITYKLIALGATDQANSAESAAKKTVAALARPEITASLDDISGKPVITWGAVEGATEYAVYRSTSSSKSYKVVATVSDTKYVASSASVGKTYYYKVVAVGSSSKSVYSDYKKIVAKCAQPQVTVKADENSGKPYIDWNKVSGAKKYYVYRVAEDSTLTRITSTTKSYYTDKKAEVGKTYTYVVQAIASSSSRNSINSEKFTCLTHCACPDLDIDILSSSGKPELDWGSVKDAVAYEIWRAAGSEEYSLLTQVTESEYIDMTAMVDVCYHYKVIAVAENTGSNSAPSNEEDATPKCAKPVATISLLSNKPMIQWNEVDGAAKYYVYRSTSKSSGYKKVATVEDESYHDTSAKKGKTYYYKIVAVSEDSKSSYSSYVKIKSK